MRTTKPLTCGRILGAIVLSAFGLLSTTASAATVSAVWDSAADVPITANGYSATGSMINFTLNFAPATGTDLMVVSNTALDFIAGTFDNLAQGQVVALSYGGVTSRFVANYYAGSGNDLVLVWTSNRAFGWGWDQYGQVGDNASGVNRLLPVPVTATGVLAGKTLVALAAGWSHSLGLCSDGTLAAWGWNREGELGDNSTSERHVPVAVNTAPGSALRGKLVVALAGGAYHSLALCADGTVAAWGKNSDGQLGDNAMSGMQSQRPVAVNTNAGVSALYGKTVVTIAAGFAHNLALCSDGTVVAWGRNDNGQLGNNTTTFTGSYVPVAVSTNSGVSALYGKTVTAIAAGSGHSVALCSDGTLATWGANFYGQLGNNTTVPTTNVPVAVNTTSGVSALYGKRVEAIAAGHGHTLALCSDGTIAAWGENQYGQLGDGTTTLLYPYGKTVPVAVNTDSGVSVLYGKTVVAIAAGYTHSLAMCADGTLAAWGQNNYGQNGDNTTTLHNLPLAVNTTPLATSQRLASAYTGSIAYHTLVRVAAPAASDVTLTGARRLPNGAVQFTFTNTPGAFFGLLGATNPALPLSNWASLTGLTEVSPGQFQFTDSQAGNNPRRFYRVRSP